MVAAQIVDGLERAAYAADGVRGDAGLPGGVWQRGCEHVARSRARRKRPDARRQRARAFRSSCASRRATSGASRCGRDAATCHGCRGSRRRGEPICSSSTSRAPACWSRPDPSSRPAARPTCTSPVPRPTSWCPCASSAVTSRASTGSVSATARRPPSRKKSTSAARAARARVPATPPQELAALLGAVLVNASGRQEPAHARFAPGLRQLIGARDVQVRAGSTGSAGGRETLYFDVPGDDRARTTLQVMFDRNHDVTDAEFRLLKAAAWLTAAVLELEKPVSAPPHAPTRWRCSPRGWRNRGVVTGRWPARNGQRIDAASVPHTMDESTSCCGFQGVRMSQAFSVWGRFSRRAFGFAIAVLLFLPVAGSAQTITGQICWPHHRFLWRSPARGHRDGRQRRHRVHRYARDRCRRPVHVHQPPRRHLLGLGRDTGLPQGAANRVLAHGRRPAVGGLLPRRR